MCKATSYSFLIQKHNLGFRSRSPEKHRIQTPTRSNRGLVRRSYKSPLVCHGLTRGVSSAGTRQPWLKMDSGIRTAGVWLLAIGLQSMPGSTANLSGPQSRRRRKSGLPCGLYHFDGPDRISVPEYIGNRRSCVCPRPNVFHRCHTAPLIASPADF